MALEIKWSKKADQKFDKILEYLILNWGENVTKNFVKKVFDFLDILAEYPEIGSIENKEKGIRGFTIVKQVNIFYRIKDQNIILLDFFDSRQDPKKKRFKLTTCSSMASYRIWQGVGFRGTLPRMGFLPRWIGSHSRGIAKQGIARERCTQAVFHVECIAKMILKHPGELLLNRLLQSSARKKLKRYYYKWISTYKVWKSMKNQPINYIQEKHTSKYRSYCSFILLLFLLCPDIHGQNSGKWVDIELVDTMKYTLFGTEDVPDFRYPPAQLFDADFSTCWVSHMRESNAYPSVFVALPEKLTKNTTLNIFSGYGKSGSVYLKNSRPKQIQIALYTALVPDGYVSEHGLSCKAFQSPYQVTFVLKDTFGIQSISFQTDFDEFKSFHQKVLDEYKTHFDFPLLHTFVLAKIKINSIYPGTVYDDICISEIFFNDCYLSAAGKTSFKSADSIYMNEIENTLLIDTEEQTAIKVYHEQKSILQIADITPDNRYAILISLPVVAGGRVETQYRIIDLINKEEISGIIENLIPGYHAGEPIFFEHKGLKCFLVSQSNMLNRIELRHFK